eukprot:scaffold88341_cov69-Phaeocystis_antarctica.AAC.3
MAVGERTTTIGLLDGERTLAATRVRHEADQRSDRPLLRLGRLWCLRDRHEVKEDVAVRQIALELRRAAAELLRDLSIDQFNHPARLHRELTSDDPFERAGKGLELVKGLAVWVPVAQPGVRHKEHWRHALLPLDERARVAQLLVRPEHLEGRRQQRLDRQDKHGEAPLQRGAEKGIAGVGGLAALAAPERRRQLCCSRLLRYRRGGRTGIYLRCRTQQSDLILQFCDLLRLRVELCALRVELIALRVELCAQECLETVEPVGIGAAGVGDAQGPRGHARGVVRVLAATARAELVTRAAKSSASGLSPCTCSGCWPCCRKEGVESARNLTPSHTL